MSDKIQPKEGEWIDAGSFYYRVTHRPAGSRVPCVIRRAEGVPLEPTKRFITKIGSELSGGDHFVFRATIAPRRGVLPHRHLFQDEIFFVVKGRFRVQVDGDVFNLQAGDLGNFTSPAIHAFHNIDSSESTALITVVPGGLENFFKNTSPWERGTQKYIELSKQYGMVEIGNDFIVNRLEMPIVKMPPGEFLMGTPDSEPTFPYKEILALKPGDDEKPQHKVKITRRFGMGMYSVTVGQFRKFVDDTGYRTTGEKNGKGCMGIDLVTGHVFPDKGFTWRTPWRTPGTNICQNDDHPVVCVSWEDANEFCKWLSEYDTQNVARKKRYRLPTEAEWEYACRAGTATRYFFGDNEAGLQKYANVADQSLQRVWIIKSPGKDMPPPGTHLPPYAEQWDDNWPFTAIVGKFQPNEWGLYDMAGNVGEWCSDWYSPNYYANSPTEDPQGPADGDEIDITVVPGLPDDFPKKKKLQVVRGGVWLDPAVAYRCADRRTHLRHPVEAGADIGFRVVLEWNDEDWDPFEPVDGPAGPPKP